ncbi:Uncharacterised protein [Streptococcus acidominimus]|uniref:Uncharacterized protein n=1 Tax=Streptococcus acidominimus TaxID=1326 RepID=A0A380IE21_STRAI|nr:Uncharacterised protein [Streptococcus acidominimus]
MKKTKFSSKQSGERLLEAGNEENEVFVKTVWGETVGGRK